MTTPLRRGFLAIVPPPEVLDAIDVAARATEVLVVRVDPARAVAHHPAVLRARRVIPTALSEGIRAAAAASAPARLTLRGGGAFPSPKKAQVFWLGVEGTDALLDLHATVAAATRDFIDRRDRIPLKPHLTIARLKRSTDLTVDVEALEGALIGAPWTLTELALLESTTKSQRRRLHRTGPLPPRHLRLALRPLLLAAHGRARRYVLSLRHTGWGAPANSRFGRTSVHGHRSWGRGSPHSRVEVRCVVTRRVVRRRGVLLVVVGRVFVFRFRDRVGRGSSPSSFGCGGSSRAR